MVGVIVISHGRLAEALISSVQLLIGNLQSVKGISIWPRDRIEEIKGRIQNGIDEVDDGDGVVILTDILGGTPTNLSLSILTLASGNAFGRSISLFSSWYNLILDFCFQTAIWYFLSSFCAIFLSSIYPCSSSPCPSCEFI